ncbi:MAG: hypothetical protein J6B92_12695 [Paraprevotella sp.]|nr:hypothetical protein [Paraprevotella sp.]MBP3472601.1 hypothetical protein [Paraprevotella sp.]
MKRVFQHIIRTVSAVGLLLTSVSCDDHAQETFSADVPPEEEGTVMLVLNTEVAGATRAAATGDIPEEEKMRTLRIVILHPDGTVEHNGHIDFGAVAQTHYVQFIPVKPNEKKTVYLLANEESVSGLDNKELDAFTPGSNGFKAKVDDLAFVPGYTAGAIPMTSIYEVEIDEVIKECQFYLVHAATKFTFRFKNMRNGPVTVNSITVSDIADRMYLMPHKQNLTMDFEEADGSITPLYWIDWLQRVAEESQANPDNPVNTQLTEERGWIMDYDIPGGATHKRVTRTTNLQVPKATIIGQTITPGTAEYPSFYLPESKKLEKPDNGAYSPQSYTMTINLKDNYNENKTFTLAFDNLKALFRNTHVVANVELSEKVTVTMQYTVCPWLDYTIKIPTFD